MFKFYVVGLAMMAATAFQFYQINQLDDDRIYTAPLLAGACVAGSFLFNVAWLKFRSNKQSWTYRASILFWTASVTVGVAAAGATLGQLAVAADLNITVPENMETLQWISLILLVGSVSLPHAFKKGSKPTFAASEGHPIV